MMRPSGMTDQTNYPVVSNVTYGPANELLHMIYYGRDETRQYNSMLQLTNITNTLNSSATLNVTYTFPAAGANAGKVMSQTDNMSGEAVNYLYDSLNRLTSATGSGWSQSYGYDGFGNLTGRTGTGTARRRLTIWNRDAIAPLPEATGWPFIRSIGRSTSVTRVRDEARRRERDLPHPQYSQGNKCTRHLRRRPANAHRS